MRWLFLKIFSKLDDNNYKGKGERGETMLLRTYYQVDEIENSVDALEEQAFQLDIIQSFELRGWALYEFGNGVALASYLDLEHIVSMGREMSGLKYGVKYLLLPLNERHDHWPTIRDLIFMLTSQGRGPFFVDLESGVDEETGKVWVEPVGAYLIDTVELDPPYLMLNLDPRLSRIKDPSRLDGIEDPAIAIHVSQMGIIRTQVMKALRYI